MREGRNMVTINTNDLEKAQELLESIADKQGECGECLVSIQIPLDWLSIEPGC